MHEWDHSKEGGEFNSVVVCDVEKSWESLQTKATAWKWILTG